MRKFILLCSLMLLLSIIPGCWDYKRIDNLAFVLGTGLDVTDDDLVEITVQIALPSSLSLTGSGSKKQPAMVISVRGKDAIEALNKLQNQLSRKITLAHRGLVVVGEKYARKGEKALRDEFLRSPYSKMGIYVMTSWGSTAKEVMQAPYILEQVPVLGLRKLLMNDPYRAVKLDGYLTLLSSTKHEQSAFTKAIHIEKMVSAPGKTYEAEGIAVYRKDKLSGFLYDNQILELSSIWGDLNQKMGTYKIGSKETIGVEFLKSRTKVDVSVRDGLPRIKVSMKFDCQVLENNTSMKLTDPLEMQRAQKMLAEQMQKNAENTLHILQKKMKSDIFGFGRFMHIQHPYIWKKVKNDWESMYPDIPINIDVKVNLLIQGRIQQPLTRRR